MAQDKGKTAKTDVESHRGVDALMTGLFGVKIKIR